MFKIGQLAKKVELGHQTIRYYERIGLLARPPRNSSGYRMYEPDSVKRIRFIRRAKDAGFTLEDIRTLLHLTDSDRVRCSDVQQIIEEKLEQIQGQIFDLKSIEKSFTKMLRQCQQSDTLEGCVALETMLSTERANK